jgi:exonuclease III
MGFKDLSQIRTQQLSKGFRWKTFRMRRKEQFFYHHLDHAFGSPFFSDRLDSFEIDEQAMYKFSDHAPVVLDFSD